MRLFYSIVLALSIGCGQAVHAFDQNHALFSKCLSKYVCNEKTEKGLVKYSAWIKDQKTLDQYLNSLSLLDEKQYDKFNPEQKKAFWINAYNACAIKAVLQNYPIKEVNKHNPANSVQQLDNFFEKEKFKVLGKARTLYDIEHSIIRKEFAIKDPRVHFAVVAPAKGEPHLPVTSFVPVKLNEQLEEAQDNFLSRSENLTIDPQKKLIRVSQVFKWFPLDFSEAAQLNKKNPPPSDDEIVIGYLKKNFPEVVPASVCRVVYSKFDWELNECKKSLAENRDLITPDNDPVISRRRAQGPRDGVPFIVQPGSGGKQ